MGLAVEAAGEWGCGGPSSNMNNWYVQKEFLINW